MKNLFENFRTYLEEDLPSSDGTVTLFHFSDSDEDNIVLDPLYSSLNPNRHSKREYQTSSVPRLFFYVDLKDKESFFTSENLYSAQIPKDKIYNLAKDEQGYLKSSSGENQKPFTFDSFFRHISGWKKVGNNWEKEDGLVDYLYYELTNGMKIVVSFIPVVVTKHDHLAGGLADLRSEGDFDPDQLRKGIEVELEHTNNQQLAKEIAMDHLVEDPEYYDKLPDHD